LIISSAIKIVSAVAISFERTIVKNAVSVVIPAFRAAGTIARALDSVLAQTVPVAQILVIDDGSPDDLAAVVTGYGSRVTLLRKPNGGAASARNVGIERATGDYIAFLDADDYWDPRKLERQLDIFSRYPQVGLIAGQYYEQPPGGERHASLALERGQFECVLALNGERAFRAATGVWTGTAIVRRDVLGGERFLSGLETAEDRDLWIRLVARMPIYFLSEPLATAVLEPNSLSRSSVARDCGNMLRVVKRNRKLLGAAGTLLWISHTQYRWAACEPRTLPRMLRLLLSIFLWPLPYSLQLEPIPHARPKQFVVNLLRLVGLRRRRDNCKSPAAVTELI
jgi:glycosyltransferase involved in cell wall biosynthesis